MRRITRTWWFRTVLALAFLVVLAAPTGIFWSMTKPVFHKDVINKYAAIYKFDPLFIMALVRVESSFKKTALSPAGAIGLMQLMPVTALDMARRVGLNVTLEDINDPDVNVHLGMHFLYLLRNEFKTDTVAILAAYNAGPANARIWKKDGPLLVEQIQFEETRYYVQRIMKTYVWLKRFQKIKKVFSLKKDPAVSNEKPAK